MPGVMSTALDQALQQRGSAKSHPLVNLLERPAGFLRVQSRNFAAVQSAGQAPERVIAWRRGRREGHAAGVQPPEGCKGPQQASQAHSGLSGSLLPSLNHAVVSSPAI